MVLQKKPVRGTGHVCIQAVKTKPPTPDQEEDASLQNVCDGTKRPYSKSEVVSMSHNYPLRFILPENCTSSPCRWIYPLTFGGGLVGGDSVRASLTIGDFCACVLTSQESSKVYHCQHSSPTRQHMTYTLGDQSLLCVLQDPVVCFRDADFHQTQVVELAPVSNLVLLDWTLSGRSALSESWAFRRYVNCVEVRLLGEVVLREMTELEDTGHRTISEGMAGFEVYGLCIVLGDHVAALSDALTHKYGRKLDLGEIRDRNLVVSVSRISYTVQGQTISGCYLKFMAASTALASEVINDITSPLLPVVGADPYQNKL